MKNRFAVMASVAATACVAAASVAVILLALFGPARPDAAACHAAPTPDCLLSIANDTARLIDKPLPHVLALIVIGSAEAAAGHADRAAATIAEARRLADGPGLADSEAPPEYKYGGETDAEVRAVLYNDIIDAQARTGASRKALADTAASGESADTRAILFLSAAGALFDFDRLDDARAFMDRAVAEMGNIGAAESHADMTSGVARLLSRMGDFAGAIAFVEGSGIDAWDHAGALAEIAAAQNDSGDKVGAAATLDLAERKAAGIDNEELRETMRNIISQGRARDEITKETPTADHGDASSGGTGPDDFTAEVNAAAALEDQFARDMAMATISRRQAYNGDLDGALNTVLRIEDRAIWSDAFNTVSFMFARDGNAEGVWAAAREIPDAELRDLALERDVVVLTIAGNPSGGATMARNISDMATRAMAYATIAWEMADPTVTEESGGAKTEGKAE